MEKSSSLRPVITKLVNLLDSIALCIAAGLVLLLIAHILLRGFFGAPILGTHDIVSLFTVVLVSFALPRCTFEKDHIAIDLLVDSFPPRLQKSVDGLISFISLVMFAVFTFHFFKYSYSKYLGHDASMTLNMLLYPFVFVMALGFLLLSLVLLFQFIEQIRN